MSNSVGVIIARFQVDMLHAGHQALIAAVKAQHRRIVILLGVNSVPATRDYPLDYQTRVMMLARELPYATFYPLPNMECDKAWSKNVDSVLHRLYPLSEFILYGGPDSFIPHYSGHNKTVEVEAYSPERGEQAREAIAQVPVDSTNFRRGVIYATQNRFPTMHSVVDIAVLRHFGGCTPRFPCQMQVLMGRKKVESEEQGSRFIGGFVDTSDLGMEQACSRELLEETGISIMPDRFTYIGSQRIDDWRYRKSSDSILTSLFVAVATDDEVMAATASDDINSLTWVPLPGVWLSALAAHKGLAKLLTDRLLTDAGDIFHTKHGKPV